MKHPQVLSILAILTVLACNSPIPVKDLHPEENFTAFETRFLDQYFKQNPSFSISVGYGKYYDNLVVPDSVSVSDEITFSRQWLDSLNTLDFVRLSDNNQISYNIIKNQLESDIWYLSEFKIQQWDASSYNLSGDCYTIIHQDYAPLDERLRALSRHIEKGGPKFVGSGIPDVE